MEVIVFGLLTDIIGRNSISPEGITSSDQLKQWLVIHYPSVSGIPYAIAVNNQIILGNSILHASDKVAILPPFSGG